MYAINEYKPYFCQVLAVYTFTKRVNLEDFETRSRKSQGLFTVSHMNLVHIGKMLLNTCHRTETCTAGSHFNHLEDSGVAQW